MVIRNKNIIKPGSKTALILATWAMMANFWAWSLLGPLATKYIDELSLSPIEISLLLAMPVIIGSLGRIPAGILADRFGGRAMFTAICLIAVIPVSMLAVFDSYSGLLAAATVLGISGAIFVVGIPFLSSWFPPNRRGFVLGIYGVGNIGTAISGLTTPSLATWLSRDFTFIIVAVMLLITASIFARWGKNAPGWKPPKSSATKRFVLAFKDRLTWDLSLIYVLTFGAFVAFGIYLPVLLKVSYGLSMADAAARASGFVIIATLARPIGGWLSDKFGGKNIVRLSLLAVAALALFLAIQPTLHIFTTAGYLSLAFALGCGNGAVFALIGKLAASNSIGSVTGIVGALGGLGGFLPPLILGFTYTKANTYSPALALLSLCAFLILLYIHRRFRRNYGAAGQAT